MQPLPFWNVIHDPVINAWRTAHLRQLGGLQCVDSECQCQECRCEFCRNISVSLADIKDDAVREEFFQRLDNVCPRLQSRLYIRCADSIRQRRCRERKTKRERRIAREQPVQPVTFLQRMTKSV